MTVEDRYRKRIVLIGPILPYRGGIAQHTTMLHRTLAEQADLLTISFSRQYPAWLFPGKSDRDPAYEGYIEPGVAYLIDSLNPLSWRRAGNAIAQFAPDTVIIPWWTIYWTFCFRVLAMAARRTGAQLVFLCHNVVEHESAFWKRGLTKWVLGTTDRFVVHTRADRANLLAVLSGATVLVQPHPIFDQFPGPKTTLSRRADLELLFFGFIRPYKGLDILLEALSEIPDRDLMLTVAGEIWGKPDAYQAQIDRLMLNAKVEFRPSYHSEEEAAELFSRADVVILPYRSATGSGIIPLAYYYGKPVIATRVGGLPDVVVPGKTGVLVTPESSREIARAIETFTAELASSMRPSIRSFAKTLTWEELAATLVRSLDRST